MPDLGPKHNFISYLLFIALFALVLVKFKVKVMVKVNAKISIRNHTIFMKKSDFHN